MRSQLASPSHSSATYSCDVLPEVSFKVGHISFITCHYLRGFNTDTELCCSLTKVGGENNLPTVVAQQCPTP